MTANIVEGWKQNLLFACGRIDSTVKQIADERLSVCAECPNRSDWTIAAICKICSCELSAKTKVLGEYCPLNIWKPFYRENENDFGFFVFSEFPILLQIELLAWKNDRFAFEDGIVTLENWEQFLSERLA